MKSTSLALITMATLSPICLADDYLPLQVGNRWEYTSPEGDETMEVARTTELWGETVYVIEYPESIHNLGLENYWTTNTEGDVFIWGFWRDDPGAQWGYLYSPPICMADAPLFLGKTWSQTIHLYSLPDTIYDGQIEIAYRVYWDGVLSVPAGDFHSYGIGQGTPVGIGLPSAYSVSGELAMDGQQGAPTNWWSTGTGLTQYWTSDIYQLERFEQPTAVAQTTWGGGCAIPS